MNILSFLTSFAKGLSSSMVALMWVIGVTKAWQINFCHELARRKKQPQGRGTAANNHTLRHSRQPLLKALLQVMMIRGALPKEVWKHHQQQQTQINQQQRKRKIQIIIFHLLI